MQGLKNYATWEKYKWSSKKYAISSGVQKSVFSAESLSLWDKQLDTVQRLICSCVVADHKKWLILEDFFN